MSWWRRLLGRENDMSEQTLPALDDEPDVWRDIEDEAIAQPTEAEVIEGNRQGQTIDPDDDADGGEHE